MKTNVLDKGYVRLLDVFGSDLTVVNAARASYYKESTELSDKDIRLIQFLGREGHMSPFRHPKLSFEVYAPLFVARQWWRYAVDSSHVEDGTAWNESSRRYVTEDCEFYIPTAEEWRSAPENSKQGSGDFINSDDGHLLTTELIDIIQQCQGVYEHAIQELDIAPEQARLFLPAYGMYVRWRWTASLQAITHFVNQRVQHDAQKEIQDYAQAVKMMVYEKFPYSSGVLMK